MNKFLLLLILAICLISCEKNDALEQALILSGQNRPELERALEHYAADSTDRQKLMALQFLIKNMPGHYSLTNAITQNYFDLMDRNNPTATALTKHVLSCLPENYIDVPIGLADSDIENIRADF